MKRLEYIDILRGISIMGVVLIHVVSMLGGVEASIWHIIFLGFTRYCVPMFFVCMGAIQLRKDRELDIHKLYTKNIPRFLVAIFLYGLLHKIIRFFLGQYGKWSLGELLLSYPKKFITGELEFSFWFMYALIPIYFMLPILRAIATQDHSQKAVKIFLGLWMLASLINGLSYLAPFSFLNTWTNGNQNLCTVYGYPGYVVLGAYLGEKEFTKSQRYVIYIIGGAACILSIVEQAIRVGRGYGLEYTLFDYYSPTTIWLAIAVFILLKYMWRERQVRKRYDRILLFAGCYSMGIYFLHTIVLLLLQNWLISHYISWRPVRSLGDVILVFSITLLIVWSMSKNKYSRIWV